MRVAGALAAFALGFVVGVLRLPWEIAHEYKIWRMRCR
jgi:hypothetical protein